MPIKNSIEFNAFNLFFIMQCYDEKVMTYEKALSVVPVFESEEEHKRFMDYIYERKNDFKVAVDAQNVNEMFPDYAKTVDTVVIYKLEKTLVQWLDQWRNSSKSSMTR